MAKSKCGISQPIEPDSLYTPESAGPMLGMTASTFLKHFVYSGVLDVSRYGVYYLFPGWALIQLIESQLEKPDPKSKPEQKKKEE